MISFGRRFPGCLVGRCGSNGRFCRPGRCRPGISPALRAQTVGGPFHVGEQVRGWHRGDNAFFFEAVEVAGEQDLGVFDSEAEGGGVWYALLRLGDDVGVGIT